MKRIVLRMFVFVLFGAVVSWGGAWACAYWQPWETGRLEGGVWVIDGTAIDSVVRRRARPIEVWPEEIRRYKTHTAAGFGWARCDIYADSAMGEPTQLIVEIRDLETGWPWRCLTGEQRWTRRAESESEPFRNAVRIGKPKGATPNAMGEIAFLPCGVITSAFVLNTITFASVPIVLYFLLVVVRYSWRRLRHRCPRCAYPRGESPVCTECGISFVKRRRRAV